MSRWFAGNAASPLRFQTSCMKEPRHMSGSSRRSTAFRLRPASAPAKGMATAFVALGGIPSSPAALPA
eukprot:1015742-Lingulodinium_polyedra.AAC.1